LHWIQIECNLNNPMISFNFSYTAAKRGGWRQWVGWGALYFLVTTMVVLGLKHIKMFKNYVNKVETFTKGQIVWNGKLRKQKAARGGVLVSCPRPHFMPLRHCRHIQYIIILIIIITIITTLLWRRHHSCLVSQPEFRGPGREAMQHQQNRLK